VFPVHPLTRGRLAQMPKVPGLRMLPPLGYLDFLSLMSHSRFALTDSGGVQEETTALGIPCLTLRESTERPITMTLGTNTIIGSDFRLLGERVRDILDGRYKRGRTPDLWDGKASARIARIIVDRRTRA